MEAVRLSRPQLEHTAAYPLTATLPAARPLPPPSRDQGSCFSLPGSRPHLGTGVLTSATLRISGKGVSQGGAKRSGWPAGHNTPQDSLIPNLRPQVWSWGKGAGFAVRWNWVHSLAFPFPDCVIFTSLSLCLLIFKMVIMVMGNLR